MRKKIGASILGAALMFSANSTVQAAAWQEMGPELPVSYNLVQASVTSAGVQNPLPTGANRQCTPKAGENPVILLHGMNSNAYNSFARLAPALQEAGKCVYTFNYGTAEPSLAAKMPGFMG